MMKTKTTAVVLGLGLAVAGFAQAPQRPKGRPQAAKQTASSKAKPASGPTIVKAKAKPTRLMAALDANRDGKLSLKEIEAAVAALKKLDTNKDGELTLQEFGPASEEAKPQPRSLGKPGGKSPRVASKPSGRPGRKPAAKPGSRPGKRPTAVAGRNPGTKKPSVRPTRPGAKPRPRAQPGRRVAKAGAAASTTARSGGASAAPSKPKRVARASISGRKPKTTSRRRPAGTAAKPAPAASPEDAALKALIGDTEAVTAQLKKAIGGIKDSKKKQAALKWVRSGSKGLLRSLNAGLKANDAAKKAAQAGEARQKLDDVRKLLE